MYIKLKGVCINIKKERNIKQLNTLIKLCNIEMKTSSRAKKEFLTIIINMILKRLNHILKNEPALEIV